MISAVGIRKVAEGLKAAAEAARMMQLGLDIRDPAAIHADQAVQRGYW
jgi:hypothetical protein